MKLLNINPAIKLVITGPMNLNKENLSDNHRMKMTNRKERKITA